MKKPIILILFVLFCFDFAVAQITLSLIAGNQNPPPIVWGRVSQEDLKMTTYDLDPDAEAVVLCDYGRISVDQTPSGWEQWVRVHRRIKILKESGTRFADVEIPFYSYERNEALAYVAAQVIQPDSTIEQLDFEDAALQTAAGDGKLFKFSLPNVQVGSVIEYSFKTVNWSVALLRDWAFQDEIPIRHSELRTFYPSRLGYSYIFQGVGDMETTFKSDTLTIMKGEVGTFHMYEKKFIMENAKAMKQEAFVTTMSDYMAKIRFQLSEFIDYRGKTRTFSNDWKQLATELEEASYFGEQYLKKKNHKKVLKDLLSLMENETSETKKAKTAYDFLNKKMKWDESFGYLVGKSLNESFEKGKGSSAELNMMLLAALLSQEIEAYPLLTSTRENGKVIDLYPFLSQFDHLMVFAVLDEDEYILDVGNNMRSMGMPRIPGLNKKGWIVDSEKSKWVEIVPKKSMDFYSFNLKLDEEGSIEGNAKCAYTGYNAMSERMDSEKDDSDKKWKERLGTKYPDSEIRDFKIENLNNLKKSFKQSFNLKISEAGQAVGDFIYFSPILVSDFEENIFRQTERNYPVDIPYPFIEQINLEIEIPKDYVVEELPERAHVILPNKGGKFRFSIEEKGENLISIVSRLELKQLFFSTEEYSGLKELFDLVVEKYGEQIVLKKRT